MAGKFTLLDDEPSSAPPPSGKFILLDDEPQGPQRFAMDPMAAEAPPPDAEVTAQRGVAYRYLPERAADLKTLATASFAKHPQTKAAVYAKARGIDPKSYAIVDGRPAYRADDGNWYFEEPRDGWTDPINSWDELTQRTAGNAGPAIPATTGTAAGIITAPMLLTGPAGVAGSVGITGTAQGLGNRLKQYIGEKLTGEPEEIEEDLMEGGMGAAGQLGAAGLTKGAQYLIDSIPNSLKNIPRTERARVNPAATVELAEKAEAANVRLTPAELTNSPSLKAEQKYLSNTPQSADKMGDYYAERALEIDNAVDRTLANISPNDSTELAGRDAINAAKGSIKSARAARSAEAKPLYEAVVNERAILDEGQFGPIAGDPYLVDAIAAVKSSKLTGMQDLPDQSLPVLDKVKKNLDYQIRIAKRDGNHDDARLLSEKLTTLLRATDDAFPDYPGARSAFAGESPAVNELEQGVAGQIAKLKHTQAREAADRLMNASRIGPLEASRTRNAIERESPEAWQGVKRAWLTAQWNKASKETLGDGAINAGPKFRKDLMGDPRQRKVLETVLSKDEFKGLSDLSDVLEAAGRVKPIGSDTAWNQEMQRLANEAATPAWAKFLRLLRPQDWGKLMEDAATRRNLGKNANRIVDIITSPQAMADLRALRQMSKGQARWAAATAKLFADIGLLDEKSIARGKGAR